MNRVIFTIFFIQKRRELYLHQTQTLLPQTDGMLELHPDPLGQWLHRRSPNLPVQRHNHPPQQQKVNQADPLAQRSHRRSPNLPVQRHEHHPPQQQKANQARPLLELLICKM